MALRAQHILYPTLALMLATLLVGCVKPKSPTPPEITTDQERVGDALFQKGNFQKAIEHYDLALKDGADIASVSYRKGYAYFAQDQWETALEQFKAAIQASPELAIAYEGAGMSAFQIGKLDDAVRYFEETRELAPKHWVPYAFLAAIYHVRGKTELAKELHDKALDLGGKKKEKLVVSTLRDAHARASKMTPAVLDPENKEAATAVTESPKPETAQEEDKAKDSDAVAEQDIAPPANAEATPAADQSADQSVDESAGQPDTEKGAEAPDAKASEKAAPEEKSSEIPNAAQADKAPASETTTPDANTANEEQTAAPEADKAQTTAEKQPTIEELAAKHAAEDDKEALKSPPVVAPGPGEKTDLGTVDALPAGATRFTILESSWQTKGQADSRVTDLRQKGLSAYTASVNLGSRGIWHRVLFGPFADLKSARAAKERLIQTYNFTDMIILQQKN